MSAECAEQASILLVDDRAENLLVLEAELEQLGQRLVQASSGREALRRLLEEDFAVILLDVQMPELDGFETAELIRQRDRSRHTPIIFVTAYGSGEQQLFRGYAVGAVDYIQKPIQPEILRSKVSVFVDLYRKTREVEQLNESLRRRGRELEAANRELEAFSYSVSHDLRAPLRAIIGFAQIVAQRHRAGLGEQGARYVGHILEASERMDRLIEDLLRYSRLGRQSLRLGRVDLAELLGVVVERALAGRTASGASVVVQESLPAVRGDRTLLEQAFANLLDNALLYREPDVPPRVEVTARREGAQVVVCVRDNGIGIAPEHHEVIFQAFRRLHGEDDYPGTGIGLAVVRKSVQLLGGEVWVESRLGEGSAFYVRLPRAG